MNGVLEIPRKNLRRFGSQRAAIFVRVPSSPAFLSAGLAVLLVRTKSPKLAAITRGWESRRLVTPLLSAQTIQFLDSFHFVSAWHVDVGIYTIRMNSPQNVSFQIPYARASSGSPVNNFRFRCPCEECISGSFRIEVLPVRLRLLSFRTTVFNQRNNLFYDDFISSWRQTAIWSSNYWIVIPTFGFHGNNKCKFHRLKFKVLSKTFFKF